MPLMSMLNKPFAILMLVLPLLALGCKDATRKPVPPPDPLPNRNFPNTDVCPHTEAPLVGGRNYVYCGSFQIAWNEFTDKFGNQKQDLFDADLPIVQALNNRLLTKSDIASDSLFTFTDRLTTDAEVTFRKQFHAKFPSATLPVLPWGSGILFAYAYLEKQLHFRDVFDRMKPAPFPASANNQVQWFGIDPDISQRSRSGFPRYQVNILNYSGPDEFVVELVTDSWNDQLLLAAIPRPNTLIDAITSVDQLRSSIRTKLRRLSIPIVSLGIERQYYELTRDKNTPIDSSAQAPLSGWQTIRFRLDEAGSTLKSEAALPAAAAVNVPPKEVDLVFDQPFLLILRQRESKIPYFALWIENAEILEVATHLPKTN